MLCIKENHKMTCLEVVLVEPVGEGDGAVVPPHGDVVVDHGVADAEGRGGEAVADGGVHRAVVGRPEKKQRKTNGKVAFLGFGWCRLSRLLSTLSWNCSSVFLPISLGRNSP